jgi:hypothetical protein
MEDHSEEFVVTREPWTVPELKKIDVDEVTASSAGPVDDGFSQQDS